MTAPPRASLAGCLLACLCLAGCERGGPRPESAAVNLAAVLAEAEGLGARGLEVQAAQLLQEKLGSLGPAGQAQAHEAIARFSLHVGDHEKALEAAGAALERGRETPAVLYLKGEAQRGLQQFAASEATLSKVIALDPGHHLARLSLGSTRARQGEPDAALALFAGYFAAASPAEPEYGRALLEYGRALRGAGRHEEAAERFMLLLEEDPWRTTAYGELAQCLYRMGRGREGRFIEGLYRIMAADSFEEYAQERLRESGSTLFALGQLASNSTRQRRYLQAYRCYRQALALQEKDARLAMYFADFCLLLRRRSEARRAVDEALASGLEPQSGLWWTRGRLGLETGGAGGGEPREAVRAFERAREALTREGNELGPERGQAPALALQLAWTRACVEAGDFQQAASVLAGAGGDEQAAGEQAPGTMPGGWETSYWRARLELARGRPAEALPHLREALRLAAARAPAELTCWSAVAFQEVGLGAEAAIALEECFRRDRGHVAAHEALARLGAEAAPRAAEAAGSLAEVEETNAAITALEAEIDAAPLEECGERYLRLGRLYQKLRRPVAFDFYFLSADLLPGRKEPLLPLLGGLRGAHDVFLRIHLLRRLLAVEAGTREVRAELAGIYRKLGVRLAEAERLEGGEKR